MLKGIIGYLDYSLTVMIFKAMEYSFFLFKASHLTTLVDCLLVFCYIMEIFCNVVDVEDTHVTLFSNDFANYVFAISYFCITHGIGH